MARSALRAAVVVLFSLFSTAQAAVPELRQPAWAELRIEQKQILAPLARDWDQLEAYRKKKWLGIAARYPGMNPQEQARVQRRMQDWARLTPEQRKHARDQYKTLQKAPPEKRETVKQKWEEYKELPEEERKRLAEAAKARPVARTGTAKPGIAKPTALAAPPTRPIAPPQPPAQAALPSGETAASTAPDAPPADPPAASTPAPTSSAAEGAPTIAPAQSSQ